MADELWIRTSGDYEEVEVWAEPNAVNALMFQALAACTATGDVLAACEAFLDEFPPDFVTWDSGQLENRPSTDEDLAATCRAIYFDSESDFSDPRTARAYIVWEAAHQWQQAREYEAERTG